MRAFVAPCLLPGRLVPLPPNATSTWHVRRRRTGTSCVQQPHNAEDDVPRRRIRVPREQTCYNPDWQWHGTSTQADNATPPSDSANWTTMTLLKVLHVLHKSGQTLTQTTAPLLTKITALSFRVLRSVTGIIERALRVDVDYADLTVEYGIAEPCPHDKTFVDPLQEWNLSNCDSFYRDSSGNAVYLQLHGPSGVVASADFRDGFEEFGDSDVSIGSDNIEGPLSPPDDGLGSEKHGTQQPPSLHDSSL